MAAVSQSQPLENNGTAISRRVLPSSPPSLNGARSCNEDYFCSICMDYLMDTVQTGCSHKFCRFCINRWIQVNPGRRCPVCRGLVGNLQSLPELDATISSYLQNNLTPVELMQRNTLRSQREASHICTPRPETIESSDWEDLFSTTSVENPLLSHSIDAAPAAEQNAQNLWEYQNNFSTNPNLIDPWSTEYSSDVDGQLQQRLDRLRERLSTSYPQPQTGNNNDPQPPAPQRRGILTNRQDSFWGTTPSDSAVQALLDIPTRLRGTERLAAITAIVESYRRTNGQRSPRHPQLRAERSRVRQTALNRQQLEDDLMQEHGYHSRRARSAYSRMVQSQQDYDFHSQEISRIREEIQQNQNDAAAEEEDDDTSYLDDAVEYASTSTVYRSGEIHGGRGSSRSSHLHGRMTPTPPWINYSRPSQQTSNNLTSSEMVSAESESSPSTSSDGTTETEATSAEDFTVTFRRRTPVRDNNDPHLYSEHYRGREAYSRRRSRRSSSSRSRHLMDEFDSTIAISTVDSEPSDPALPSQRSENSSQSVRSTVEQVHLPQRTGTEYSNNSGQFSFLSRFRSLMERPIGTRSESSPGENVIERPISDVRPLTGVAEGNVQPDSSQLVQRILQFQAHHRNADMQIIPDHEVSTPIPTSNNLQENFRPSGNGDVRKKSKNGRQPSTSPNPRNILTQTVTPPPVVTTNASSLNDVPAPEQMNVRIIHNPPQLPIPDWMSAFIKIEKYYKKNDKNSPRSK